MNLNKRLEKIEELVGEVYVDRTKELHEWFRAHQRLDDLEKYEQLPKHLWPTFKKLLEPGFERTRNSLIKE